MLALNPFANERRILCLVGVLVLFNLLLFGLNPELAEKQERLLRESHPGYHQLSQWLDTPLGIVLSILFHIPIWLLYWQLKHHPEHRLARLSAAGIKGYSFVFGMAAGGLAGFIGRFLFRVVVA